VFWSRADPRSTYPSAPGPVNRPSC
jgi:hypothetical protein